MKKNNEDAVEILGNDTEMRLREPKKIRPKNSDLIKALALVDYDYEEYDEYDAPIIEIKFKRDTTSVEDVESAFARLKESLFSNESLLQHFRRWSSKL